jgi:hypothetical protein
LAIENDAWSVVEPPFGFGELAFGNGVKVDALREVFSYQAINIFQRTALPGTKRIAKIDGDFGGDGEGGMLGHPASFVVGEGLAQIGREAFEGLGQGSGDALGVLGRAQGNDDHVAGNLFGDHQDGRAVACAHDQVGLPVPGYLPAVDLGWALADVGRSGQLAGELALGAGRGVVSCAADG